MLAYLFVVIAVAARFLPHPWHFTPVAASLLFFGARGPRRQMWIPFALLAASDIVLTKVIYAYPFEWDHFVTWAWYAAILGLGTWLRDNSTPLRIVAAALTSSVSFFLISNFAVWACYHMYPKTFSGLLTCYALGLPFFQRGLVGDLLFTSAMFAVPALVTLFSEKTAGRAAAA